MKIKQITILIIIMGVMICEEKQASLYIYKGGWPVNTKIDSIIDPGFDLPCPGPIGCECRTNSDCISISNMLDNNNILHNYTNDKLFEKAIIKDVISLLNLVTSSKYNLHSLIRLTKNKFNSENPLHSVFFEKNLCWNDF